MIRISVACPRCGCHLTRHFTCNCGEVHGDTCLNCGRFTHLGPTEYLDLCETDARCSYGPVAHAHSEEEKAARIAAFFAPKIEAIAALAEKLR